MIIGGVAKIKNVLLFFKYKLICKRIRCIGLKKTLNALKSGASVSRYGDGELAWAAGINYPQPCGTFNPDISRELCSRLLDDSSDYGPNNHLKCINTNVVLRFSIHSPLGLRRFYKDFLLANVNNFFPLFLQMEGRLFGEACFPYVFREKIIRRRKKLMRFYSDFKNVIQNKTIIVVEGANGRMGVGNDFLSSAQSIKRILCPSYNAFNYLGDIKKALIPLLDDDSVVLLALGPAATLLVHDLSSANAPGQFIDIGSFEQDYVQFLKNFNICSKQNATITDAQYNGQIISTIG